MQVVARYCGATACARGRQVLGGEEAGELQGQRLSLKSLLTRSTACCSTIGVQAQLLAMLRAMQRLREQMLPAAWRGCYAPR